MRRAILEVIPELLSIIGPVFDHGLEAVYSVQSAEGTIALVIQGEALPPECEVRGASALQVVQVELTQEAYGSQRMIRVSAIRPTGQTGLDVHARALRAA